MPPIDAVRWNARYSESEKTRPAHPREILMNFHQAITPGGLVLDVAMGLGGNAKFLVKNGYRVVGLDISSVAVRKVKQYLPDCMALIADTCEIAFPSNIFDAILNCYYLDRSFLREYDRMLKPAGVLFLETPINDPDFKDDSIPREYLMGMNELLLTFQSWDILYRRRFEVPRSSRGKRIIGQWVMRKK
jgi:SAM-dependent methyltransferase